MRVKNGKRSKSMTAKKRAMRRRRAESVEAGAEPISITYVTAERMEEIRQSLLQRIEKFGLDPQARKQMVDIFTDDLVVR